MRPEVGTQAQFKKRKAPKTYRYDSSLDPALSWDDGSSRAMGEWLLDLIVEASKLAAPHRFPTPKEFLGAGNAVLMTVNGLEDAVRELQGLGKPFLDWAGKAERLSMDVPTLPLFIHERLSTQAILETLRGHKREGVDEQASLFGDAQRPLAERMKPYEHRDKWVNRMVLGDSLVVMNSMLEYEGMGGQVQMIYMDPPYGVKFGSNFQPFVRKRDVKHNDDADLTREPEMVQAYRDTWELGLHSYLTYLRDRLVIARDLLTPSGSIFVQISDDNLHHVRELLDEVFGAENRISVITFIKTTSSTADTLGAVADYLLWYSKDVQRVKYRALFNTKEAGEEGTSQYIWAEAPDRTVQRKLSEAERNDHSLLPKGWRIFAADNASSSRAAGDGEAKEITALGRTFPLRKGSWKTSPEGFANLEKNHRLIAIGASLMYKRYFDDFPASAISNVWRDTLMTGFSEAKNYVVQTSQKVLQRCILMTTDPGELVFDPTCGSGTAAFMAEHWGRRWITCDASRVPLALARQRLLTATFPWYKIKGNGDVPSSGFEYVRKQNKNGQEIGGVFPYVTLKSIANQLSSTERVLVDRPEEDKLVTRITGPFCFEATIPTPLDVEGSEKPETERAAIETPSEQAGTYLDRMLDILRRSPLLRLEGNRTVQLQNIRPLTRTLAGLVEANVDASAEGQTPTLTDVVGEAAEANGLLLRGMGSNRKPVAIVFGPENGSISEGLVYSAAKEATAKDYTHLYCIGFAIEPNARQLIQSCEDVMGIAATYVQATMDLNMGDLLKNMRSSQIFSVCGLPDVTVTKGADDRYQVELVGLDVFDPISMENHHAKGDDVPAWMLDTDYNGMCFHVTQAFFPRTSAWDALKKALKADYEASLWDHLAGSISAPFESRKEAQIAVKVIDDRGNELMVVKKLSDATMAVAQ
ncbi:site-specific DNA-methyltransferase [Granulicella arctica]|uniref:site-specific DNA-methyltransferase n=1 Tax=Granulicella arctica TaxID=940613 RepID=UPI0021E0241C|nr:site-specific DNA-methyltransferase [Granulicella arctica]